MPKSSDNRRRADGPQKRPRAPSRRSLSWTTAVLSGLGEDIRQAHDLETALRAVTTASVQLTRSLQSTLRLLDESGKRLLTSARTGPSVHRQRASPFRFGEGFIGWVQANRKPAFTNQVAADPRFVTRPGQIWTPSAVLAVPLLSGSDCIGVLSISRKDRTPYRELDLELLQLVSQLSVPYLEIARLKRLNESDPLTLLHNRRHLQERLPTEINRARQTGRPLALSMIDIDHFKRVNDTHGHDVGDEVLCGVSERLRQVSRSSDVMARWGGEEFLAIFPQTSLRQARRITERIRKVVGAAPVDCSAGPIYLTVSLGLTAMTRKDDQHTLIHRVDQALYAAKREGRDRVVVQKPD